MSHEHNHHHHHGNENTETENYAAATDVVYADDSSGYGNVPVAVDTTEVVTTRATLDDGSIAETHKRTHKREEVVGGLGALAAGAFAVYERHEMEEDPENAARHKLEMEVAAGVAVTGAGVGLYGHHEKEEAEEDREELEEGPEKKHGWFGGDEEETTNEYSEDQPEKKSSWF
ncbi:unnamed protein product [Sphagnum troendelagicum]|uniref:Uncharacterized protein n=1 Tax=Sphagnum troendelagicum TaxID=128251 RepID=A0ABP0TBA0_9BRYO